MDNKAELWRMASALRTAQSVLKTQFWRSDPGWGSHAALTYCLVHLNDVLGGLSKMGHRISFTDDTDKGDVTDLVNYMRNLTCHFGSASRVIGNNNRITLTIIGQGEGMRFNDLVVANPYEDDVMFCFGEHTLLVGRHLVRAANEAEAVLRGISEEKGIHLPHLQGR